MKRGKSLLEYIAIHPTSWFSNQRSQAREVLKSEEPPTMICRGFRFDRCGRREYLEDRPAVGGIAGADRVEKVLADADGGSACAVFEARRNR